MSSIVKQEFFQWISEFRTSTLSDIELKLLNLLVNNFDALELLSTSNGSRAKKINELIQKQHFTLSTEFPDVHSHESEKLEKYDRVTELNIGPFRGFSTNELFIFDKQYTFMYGPNGSGKSSFCEGLEYALLGGIEEADSKRISLVEYIRNTQKIYATPPIAYSLNVAGQKVTIPKNQSLYRFAFVEKNRIDGFARITATTASAQKDRITTLFGLDAFSAFVDGFTDNFENEKYITLVNSKAAAFKIESQKHEDDKKRILDIDVELLKNIGALDLLIKDVSQDGVNLSDELELYLNGADKVSGRIGELQRSKMEQIADDLKTESLELLPTSLSEIKASLKSLNADFLHLMALSSDINFKDLYSVVALIGTSPDSDLSHCPACKTLIDKVAVNPFENAIAELGKLESLSKLQERISETGTMLSKNVRNAISTIITVNKLANSTGYAGHLLTVLTEFEFNNTVSSSNSRTILESELLTFENLASQIGDLRILVANHNTVLSAKREQQKAVDGELIKHQGFNTRHIELIANEKRLSEEKQTRKDAIDVFTKTNAIKLKEIEDEDKRIVINQQYVDAYKKLIPHLKLTRNRLPAKLSAGLSEKVMEFYNIINAHDPNFELLDSLALPATAGEKIEIKFKDDPRTHDALHILSEGHIKVLGLTILLAKAVHENLGFLIFDDIVNAIDDDHRGGIAELLLLHEDLKKRQHILTCHGETFINKLEQKLGTALAGKNVKSYRFIPADTVTTRGVQVSIGESKHYLLKAEESLNKNNLKDSATDCRRAVESISYQLWKTLDKHMKINLEVTMRSPGAPPDLSTVIDSLIKQLKKVRDVEELSSNLIKLKAKYPWSLLNKGVHEDENQPEFERKDIIDLVALVRIIEENVAALKLTVLNAGSAAKVRPS